MRPLISTPLIRGVGRLRNKTALLVAGVCGSLVPVAAAIAQTAPATPATPATVPEPAPAAPQSDASQGEASIRERGPVSDFLRLLRDRAQRRNSGDTAPLNEQGDTQRPPAGLAGNWFGIKPALDNAGVALTGRYSSEAAANYAGGQRGKIVETGQLDLGVRLDMRKIAGIGGTFQATVTWRRGDELGAHAGLGTLQQVQEVWGRGQTWRLTQFWYEQDIGGNVDLKLGRTAPGEDFAAFSCAFQNLSFCGSQPGNLVGNYWYNWPVSQWGGRLRANRHKFYIQIAAYEENPRNLDNDFVLGHFHGATGALIPVEIGMVSGGEGGRPVGSYKIGAWLSTADAPDVFLNVARRPIALEALAPLQRSSGHGFWINLQQQVSGRSDQGKAVSGVTLFLNATKADSRTATVDSQIAAGMFAKGVIPGLPEDVLGLGFARTHVNGRVADGQMLAGVAPQGSEYAAELYYGFRPRSWLELRPNLQWIHHAGGYGDAREIGVIGLKTSLSL